MAVILSHSYFPPPQLILQRAISRTNNVFSCMLLCHISGKAAPEAMGLEDLIPLLSLEIMSSCVVLTRWSLTPPPPVSPQFPVGLVER